MPWPRGMRIIYWLSILNLFGGIVTLTYKVLIARDLTFLPTNAGQWIILAAHMTFQILAVVAGLFRQRIFFAFTALVSVGLSMVLTCWYNAEISADLARDLLQGQAQYWFSFNSTTAVYLWNGFVILLDASICFYLLRYELLPRMKASA